MILRDFLKNCLTIEKISSPVIYFTGNQIPVLFFSHLIQKIKYNNSSFKTFSYETFDWQQFESTLSTTFLGAKQLFWLSNLSSLSAPLKKKALAYLSVYLGPHTVICFVETKDLNHNNKVVIDLNQPIEKIDIEILFAYFFKTKPNFFMTLVKNSYKNLSLDMILLLAQYSSVLGANSEQFMHQWYEKIVLPKESLFTLAQSFFSRKKDVFYRSWIQIKEDYPGPFWTTFWSEQLFKATYVIHLRQQHKLSDAKQMSYKLPFSFIQKDWQSISVNELKKAHKFLYSVDRSIKLGGSFSGLELFYYKFMTQQF